VKEVAQWCKMAGEIVIKSVYEIDLRFRGLNFTYVEYRHVGADVAVD
jgi:hypothetical protein